MLAELSENLDIAELESISLDLHEIIRVKSNRDPTARVFRIDDAVLLALESGLGTVQEISHRVKLPEERVRGILRREEVSRRAIRVSFGRMTRWRLA